MLEEAVRSLREENARLKREVYDHDKGLRDLERRNKDLNAELREAKVSWNEAESHLAAQHYEMFKYYEDNKILKIKHSGERAMRQDLEKKVQELEGRIAKLQEEVSRLNH